jgi:NAD(P)H-hydrate epimerase
VINQFITNSGVKVTAVTLEQMKEIDRIAIEMFGPNLFQMMENAGRNLTELTIKVLGKDIKQNILILAGTGGNGGGGISAARHLTNRGYNVTVCLTDLDNLKDVTAYQMHILKSTDTKIISISDLQNEKPDLIIDAIIGYSLVGEPKGNALEMIKWVNNQLTIKISLDVPSGIDATFGIKSKNYIKPDLTLTLALPKTGLLSELTGELFLGDLGITQSVYKKVISSFSIKTFENGYVIPIKSIESRNADLSKS